MNPFKYMWRVFFGYRCEKFVGGHTFTGAVVGGIQRGNSWTSIDLPIYEVWNSKTPEITWFELRQRDCSPTKIDKNMYTTYKKVVAL